MCSRPRGLSSTPAHHHKDAANTAPIATGHANRSAQTHHLRPNGVVSLNSSSTMDRLIRQPTNTLVAKAPAGSSTLDGMKSTQSKNVLSLNPGSQLSGCHADQRLNDSTEPTLRTHDADSVIATAATRDILPRCCSHAMTGSKPAIDGVTAANTSSTKNNVPTSRPPGISANTVASTSNTSSGPCAGFIPYRKTSGKTINVARSDTTKIDALMMRAARISEVPFAT